MRIEATGKSVHPIFKVESERAFDSLKEGITPLQDWRSALESQEREQGLDALAWYVSFHNSDPEWGIYVPISSLHYIAGRYLKGLRYPYEKKMELAFTALLHHESMHYAIDRNVAGWEFILGTKLHGSVSDRLKHYGYIPTEESICNAHKLREMATICSEKALAAMTQWVLQSPLGYRDAVNFLEDDQFQLGLNECIKIYAAEYWAFHLTEGAGPAWIRWTSQFQVHGDIDLSYCPVFLIDDQLGLGISPVSYSYLRSIPEIVETKKFQKMLNRSPDHVKNSWLQKRDSLKVAIPRHPEFEKLKGRLAGTFSIRLNDNFRAHLRPSLDQRVWEAVAIGPHKAMGHG